MNLITRFSDLEGEEKKEKERLMLKVAGRFIGIVNESNLQAKKKEAHTNSQGIGCSLRSLHEVVVSPSRQICPELAVAKLSQPKIKKKLKYLNKCKSRPFRQKVIKSYFIRFVSAR